MYKNIEKQAVLQLKDLVEYQTGQVVSKTLVTRAKKSPRTLPAVTQW